MVSLKINDPKGAIVDATKAISINDDHAEVYTIRAQAYQYLQDKTNARNDILKSIALDPNLPSKFIEKLVLEDTD